ncbi:MAG: leucine-rich repeat protein [Butyrivibrio sp.]|nr:leucine-rich repeat protein [Butyrivibrio sp.]
MKRLLASILCASLIVSPVGYHTTAYATEAAQETGMVSELVAGDDAVGAAVEGADGDDDAADQTAKFGESSDDASGAASQAEGKSEDETKPDDGAAGDTSEEGKSTDDAAAGDTSSEGEADGAASDGTDGAAEDASGEVATADGTDAAAEGASGSDAAAAVLSLEGEAVSAEEPLVLEASSDDGSECFEVDADGVLHLKSGSSLSSTVYIPEEAKVIPKGIFNNNSAVKNIEFVTKSSAGSQLQTIEAEAFYDSDIKKIEIPAGVTEIAAGTFESCDSLTTVTFKGKVTKIGENAFRDSAITNIIARNVTEVGRSAFGNCTSLTAATMTNLVTIGDSAFSGCTNLTQMSFPKSLTSIGANSFLGCSIEGVVDLSGCATLTLGDSCFQNNNKMTSLVLPDDLYVIPRKAFSGCSKLKDIVFGTSYGDISVIKENAFENCSSITGLEFYNVYDFASKAFGGCSALTEIIINYRDTDEVTIATDAFPENKNITMKGYDGNVQDYAEKRGYKYESLGSKYTISCTNKNKDQLSVKLSTDSAHKGTEIKVTVKPAEGYVLKSISGTGLIFTLVEATESQQVFSFEMPERNVTFTVTAAKKEDATSGSLKGSITGLEGYSVGMDTDGKTYLFDSNGRVAQMNVADKNGTTNKWLWNYSSSNASIASVTNTGKITTLAAGKTTIKATLKTDNEKTVSIPIRVTETQSVEKIALKFPKAITRGIISYEDYGDDVIPVVSFVKSALSSQARSFDVEIAAFSDADADVDTGDNLYVTSTWKSADTSVAKVTKSSLSNKNIVNVVKGSVGESMITVTVLNKGEKAASDDNTKSFIVRVVDTTPRLASSTYTVDSNSTLGTALGIVTVYDYTINTDSLELCTRSVAKSGEVTYTKSNELEVYESGSEFYIRNCSGSPFSKTFTEGSKLYLKGDFEGDGAGSFEIPISKITVTNNALNPTIKTSGKINLFYNETAGSDLTGSVIITQSDKNLVVNSVELVSAANYKKANSEDEDSFAANFNIDKLDGSNQNFIVTRTDDELVEVNGKPVTSGYLYIYCKGYSSVIKKAITIPTAVTTPSYVLSKTSATASTWGEDQEYKLQLLDKKTKEVLSLDDLDDDLDESNNTVGLGLTLASTEGLFEELDIADAMSSDTITLKVDGTPFKGTAVIYVKKTTWSKALTYKFSLNVTNSLPTIKPNSSTATLNKTYPGQKAVIRFTSNQEEAALTDDIDSIYYSGSSKLFDAGDAIASTMDASVDPDSGELLLEMGLPSADIPDGTYSFKFAPVVSFDTGETANTKVQTFKVVVKKTTPTLKFSNSTFKLSTLMPGTEEVERAFTIGNLPTGVAGEIDSKVAPDMIAVGSAPKFEDIAEIEFESDSATVKLKDNSKVKALYAGKTFSYKVHGLQASCGSDSAQVDDATIKIQLNKAEPVIKIKSTGSINPVDTTSEVKFIATVSNVVSEIATVNVWEANDSGTGYYKDGSDYCSKHFTIEKDDEDSMVSHLMVADDEILTNNKKYNLVIVYTLSADTKAVKYKAKVTVTPKQVLPDITTDKKEAVIYAGANQENREVKVKISLKNNKNINAKLQAPIFASGTSAEIKKAFTVTAFEVNEKEGYGIMTLKLTTPSAIAQDKTYTLNFETTYENQAEKSTGNKFSLKVTVNK